MSNNDISLVFYLLFIAIFDRFCWTGVKNRQGPSISSFLVFGHKFERGEKGERGRGRGGARVRRCRKDNADPGHRMIVPLGLCWGGGVGMKGGGGMMEKMGEKRGNQRRNGEEWVRM
jgi:hypothetical protein